LRTFFKKETPETKKNNWCKFSFELWISTKATCKNVAFSKALQYRNPNNYELKKNTVSKGKIIARPEYAP